MGFFRKIFRFTLLFAGFVGVILLMPNTFPAGVKFSEFYVTRTKELRGFTYNDLLNNAERLFEDEIKGPEGFAIANGELYTTLHGGYVAKVYEDQIVPVVKFGEPCEGWWEESKCGRPLGIKAISNDYLVVADSYLGIYKYNLKDKKYTTIVDKDVVIDKENPKIFNAVDVARDGTIFWTQSSAHYDVQNVLLTFLADGTGRLMKYDPKTKKSTVLIKDLWMANGVALSPDEDFLLVSESGRSRIHRYFLKGPKKFTSEIFLDGLPGIPDNLRLTGENTFFVSLFTTRNDQYPSIFQSISPFPNIRKFFAQLISIMKLLLEKLNSLYPNYFFKRSIHLVGHLEPFTLFLPVNASILEVDLNGNLVKNYHGFDGSVSFISDAIVHNGYLYLGSPSNNYLGRVKLTKLGRYSAPRMESSKPSHKPVDSPPPPSTTTRPPPPRTTKAPPPPRTTNAPPPPRTTKAPSPSATSPPPTTTTKSPPPPPRTAPPNTPKTTKSYPSTATSSPPTKPSPQAPSPPPPKNSKPQPKS